MIEEGPIAGADVPELAVAEAKDPTGLLRWQMTRLNGEKDDLSAYAGKVVLLVNTASECGFTPQFEGLQNLYEQKRADGLVILGFPSNDFAGQEPRSNDEIASFCKANFGVEFPMFAKSAVIGDAANPLFAELPAPEWNFSKYLLDRNGELVASWGSATEPDDPELLAAIDAEL
jgi:glutathione peroxidase